MSPDPTEFDYDVTHGGVTEVREPADEDGVRPTTRFAYAQNYPRYMRSNSSVGNADAQVYVLTNTSKCRTGSAPACVGTAEEQVSEFTYTAGADATNLQVLEATVRAGSGTPTATVKFAYNTAGRISAIDGPQPSTADTTYQLYDTLGRVVAVVSPDPDGSGSLPRPVQTFTYATSGHLTETATGYTYSPWYGVTPPIVQMTREVLEYDMYGRLKALSTKAPGNTASASMVSYDYDNAGRLTCEIVRLSPPNSASGLPGTACTAMSAGVYGPDRISAYTYDTLDRVTEVRAAVGTPLEQVSLKQAYNSNGTTSWVEDSNGNRTAYEYDGFDRAAKAISPSPTTPGTANAADYEAYTYDAAGNPLTRRTRAGETFSFAYDDRDRLLVKTVPERVGLASTHTRDVYYGYDLFGDLLFARFDSVSGEGVSAEYDALGRPTSIVTDIDGASRELSATFDIVGNVTSLTYPDSHTFTYQYDAFGRLTTLVDGSTPLAQFGYGSRGGVSSITRSAGGAPRSYFGYDALARPTQLGIDNAGSNGVEWLMGYSPAAQAVRVDRDNDAYAWDGHVNVDRNYTTNGLNQYSAVGSTTFTYDANGNLTSDGSAAFTYDPENRLVASTGGNGANLRYDPLGRLYEVIDTTTSDTTRFVYDGDALVAEYDGSGTLLRRHVHGVSPGDDPLITYEGATVGSANLRHLYADRLGSIVLMTDHDGVAPSINSYDEYGIPSSSNEGRFQYTGQVWLPELGMYYYKARMYSPTLGRFMQTDPIGYSDGMNWYAYTRNDPVNGVDPSGLAVVADGGHTMYLTGQMVCEVGQDPASGLCGDFWPGFVAPYVNIRYELENPVGFADVGGFGGGGAPVSGAAPPSPDIFVTALKAKAKTTAKSTTRGRVSGYRPQKEDGLLDKLKDLVCALPTLGIGGGADVYAGLGGSVGGSYNFDLANGRFGGSAYVGVGVGLGANVGVQGTGAPSGGGTVSANVGVSGGFAAPVAPGLNVGASGTYNVIGTDPGFSGGALGRAGTPSVYGNLQANGGFMTPSLYDLGC